jgi:hypothetical protein
MVKEFLSDYGILVSATLLTVGWFIIFNANKYITSRNEAKVFTKDITNLIEDAIENSIEFWSDFDVNNRDLNYLFFKKSSILISKIRSYINILNKYGINLDINLDIIEFKKLLTFAPDLATQNFSSELKKYKKIKIVESERMGLSLITKINNDFINKYKPTKSPILHRLPDKILRNPSFQGSLYGLAVAWIYFKIGSTLLS